MKKLILISQSPADLRYVIDLYEEFKEHKEIKIVVITVINNFNFLKTLDLKADIKFVPLVGKGNILRLLFFFINLRSIYKNLFSKCEGESVYFFSNTMDYVTAYFVKKLSERNAVYFIDIYKIEGPDVTGIIIKIITFILKLTLGINIRFLRHYTGDICYQYNSEKDNIISKERRITSKLKACYQYRALGNTKRRKLVFFEGNGVLNKYYVNYEKNLRDCIETLSLKYEIFIKPHPRVGFSQFLIDCNVEILPPHIPAEFISLSDFDVVLGIETVAIAKVIIGCFDFNKQSTKNDFKERLEVQSDGYLQYVDDLKAI